MPSNSLLLCNKFSIHNAMSHTHIHAHIYTQLPGNYFIIHIFNNTKRITILQYMHFFSKISKYLSSRYIIFHAPKKLNIFAIHRGI